MRMNIVYCTDFLSTRGGRRLGIDYDEHVSQGRPSLKYDQEPVCDIWREAVRNSPEVAAEIQPRSEPGCHIHGHITHKE